MKTVAALVAMLVPFAAVAQPVPGDVAVTWNAGAADCAKHPQPPLAVHRYDSRTIILRQSPCADFEAPLLYLLIGSKRALLIDSGAVADAAAMPLAKTVADLLPSIDGARLPLLVVHTHGHGDHHAGDAQLAALSGTEVVSVDPGEMQAFYGIEHWPDDFAHVDLGDRVVEVLPIPGHEESHLLFYDRQTGIAFTGDFLLPGRLLVDDLGDYRASAQRAVEFLRDKPVSHVFGAHVELDAKGALFASGATHHPDERVFVLTKADLEGLPRALDEFNGFYSTYPNYVVVNPYRNLLALVCGVVLALTLLAWALRKLVRSLKARKSAA